jgi:hypothetical protein
VAVQRGSVTVVRDDLVAPVVLRLEQRSVGPPQSE